MEVTPWWRRSEVPGGWLLLTFRSARQRADCGQRRKAVIRVPTGECPRATIGDAHARRRRAEILAI